jgi:molybdate/tungstate transport system ATP-binding protein
MDLADALGVSGVLASEARVLSGGELQRLNLARVLARSEEWVILDEPLAPLDVRDRERVAGLIAEAIGDRGSIIVTHHRESAAIFGDKVIVVIDGAVAQEGPIREVFSLPASESVAEVVGVSNVLSGEVQRREGVLGLILAGDLEIWARTECDVGDVVKLLIPAESVTVFASGGTPVGSARNRWDGVIGELRPAASLVEALVQIGQSRVVALVTQGSVDGLGLAPSVGVTVAVKASAVRAIGR